MENLRHIAISLHKCTPKFNQSILLVNYKKIPRKKVLEEGFQYCVLHYYGLLHCGSSDSNPSFESCIPSHDVHLYTVLYTSSSPVQLTPCEIISYGSSLCHLKITPTLHPGHTQVFQKLLWMINDCISVTYQPDINQVTVRLFPTCNICCCGCFQYNCHFNSTRLLKFHFKSTLRIKSNWDKLDAWDCWSP